MVVKRFIISISMLFFGALLLQAKNEVIDHGQFLCSYYYCYSKDTIKNDEKEEDLLFLSERMFQNATAIIRINRILYNLQKMARQSFVLYSKKPLSEKDI